MHVIVLSVATAAALAAGGPTVLWWNAYEVGASGVEVAEPGEYTVWLWVRDDAGGTVTVAGKGLEAGKRSKPKKEYVWLRAGTANLKAGTVALHAGVGVAGVVLSTAGGFDPKVAIGHRRVFDQPERVHDRRAETAKHTDTVFTMPEFGSLDAWQAYAEKLRKRILLSSGLWPLPERTPLDAVIGGRVEHEDYSVEKVRIEARPGFLVTGNLYRPVGEGPFPGVVCPHGHWEHGRLHSDDRGSVPGRCITLARMGAVVFTYDMVGYNDSLQFEHRWGGKREKLWGIHPFAAQLWSSMRAVDFLEALPEVDAARIACTGASGGGTQTFALMAVDTRIQVAAPVNMISSTMQGGCLCENAPILRLDNSNMEIGALMAPRPLLLVSATGDWTRETPRVEYPAIRSIYQLHDAQDRVANVHVDAGHNYNQASREAMYRFFGKWLLGDEAKWARFEEPEFSVESEADLRVFPDKTLPEELPTAAEVIARNIAANRAKWQAILPKNADDAAAFRAKYGDALALVLGAAVPETNELALERVGYQEHGDYVVERWVLGRRCAGDAIAAIFYRAADARPQEAVLVVHGQGKAALADAAGGGPGPLVAGLIAQGKAVLAIDAFLLGEHHAPQARTKRKRVGGFMDTFQPTDTGYRIQDVLTALAYLRSRRDLTGTIDLVGLEQAGLWGLFAGAIDEGVRNTVIDANGFDPDDDEAWIETYYTPCIRAVGDVDTAAAMIAPRRLVVCNASESFVDGVRSAYGAVGSDGLTVYADALGTDTVLAVLE